MIARIKYRTLLWVVLTLSPSLFHAQPIPFGYRSLSPMPVKMGDALLSSLSFEERSIYQNFTSQKTDVTIVDQLHFLYQLLESRLVKNYQNHLSDLMISISGNNSATSISDFNLLMDQAGYNFQDSLAVISDLLIKASEFQFLAKRNTFLPSRTSIDAQLFYRLSPNDNRSKFLNLIYLSLNNSTDQVSLYNELFSDFLGPVRMSFGALISNQTKENDSNKLTSNDVLQSNAMQRLLGGGGNGVVTFSLPLYYFGNSNLSNGVRLSFAPKFSFDVPNLGSQTNTVVKNMDVAIELNGYVVGHNDVISVFINNRFGRLYGSNEFYQNLSSDGSFFLNQCTFGFSISSNFVLSYNWFYSSDPVLDKAMDSFISFSVIPSL